MESLTGRVGLRLGWNCIGLGMARAGLCGRRLAGVGGTKRGLMGSADTGVLAWAGWLVWLGWSGL